jgi:hypothetical protein
MHAYAIKFLTELLPFLARLHVCEKRDGLHGKSTEERFYAE